MSESYAEFQEADGSVRMAGQLAYPQATPSDVLTVQDDGTIAAAAGGGSQPADSQIFVTQIADQDVTGAAILWQAGYLVGTDLALNADTQHIDILTDGLYAAWFDIQLVIKNGTPAGVFSWSPIVNAAAPNSYWNFGDVGDSLPIIGASLAVSENPYGFSIPITKLQAGDNISVTPTYDDAGIAVLTAHNCDLYVVKLSDVA